MICLYVTLPFAGIRCRTRGRNQLFISGGGQFSFDDIVVLKPWDTFSQTVTYNIDVFLLPQTRSP